MLLGTMRGWWWRPPPPLTTNVDGLFGHLELHGLVAAGLADSSNDTFDNGNGLNHGSGGLALCVVDGSLLLALGRAMKPRARRWRC